MKKRVSIALAISALFTLNSSFAGDIAAGQAKAALCASCHGSNGVASVPTYPNLAGQNAPYLVSALKSYRDKNRSGGMAGIMQMQAANLSDSDIDNLAAYFASLK
jgi:cytochrome c553